MRETILETVHKPEYTGENRCGACTGINLVITLLIGSVIARKSKLGGTIAVGISIGLIYLRGYLVPGTPTVTRRYLPPEVLRWFEKEPESAGSAVRNGFGAIDVSTASDHDIEQNEAVVDHTATRPADDSDSTDAALTAESYFLEHGVIEPCESTDDLCLSSAFEATWSEAIDEFDIENIRGEDVSRVFGIDSDDVKIEYYDSARVLRRGSKTVGKWPSRAALVADVTAAGVLESRDPEWKSYSPEQKGQLLNTLRLFLETCPTSGGEVVLGEETVESCCSSYDVIAATCSDTNERLFEHRVDELEA